MIVPTRPDPAQPSQPCPAHLYLGCRPHSQLGWLLPDPWQWEFSPWAFQNLNKVLEKFSLISFVSVLLWVIIRSGNRTTFCVSSHISAVASYWPLGIVGMERTGSVILFFPQFLVQSSLLPDRDSLMLLVTQKDTAIPMYHHRVPAFPSQKS